jgi:uncharacterized SAM-binding protein YcdF (DUF218 family)
MSKSKSIFVTVIMTAMLAAIVVGLYTIQFRAFLIFLGLLGAYGFLCVAVNFYRWLGEESPLLPDAQPMRIEPIKKVDGEIWQPGSEWHGTYDQIREEMEGETV